MTESIKYVVVFEKRLGDRSHPGRRPRRKGGKPRGALFAAPWTCPAVSCTDRPGSFPDEPGGYPGIRNTDVLVPDIGRGLCI